MALVKVEIKSAAHPSEDTANCSFYAPVPVTMGKVLSLIPYEGDFHLRVKVTGESVSLKSNESLWMDIGKNDDPNKTLPIYCTEEDTNIVYVQAILMNPQNFPAHSCKDDDQYLSGIASGMPLEAKERLPRQVVDMSNGDGSISGMVAENVAQGAAQIGKLFKTVGAHGNSIFNSVTSGVTSMFGMSSSFQSDRSVQNLRRLVESMGASQDVLRALLQDVTKVMFVEAGAEQSAEQTKLMWKTLGWQKEDPVSELKSTGALALTSMVYLGRVYPGLAKEMLERNKVNNKSSYPYAIVGINITLLLVEMFQLKENAFLQNASAAYWQLFEDVDAFHEIFSICFIYMDMMWTQSRAARSDFGKLIAAVKAAMAKILRNGPRSVHDFKQLAMQVGMLPAGFF